MIRNGRGELYIPGSSLKGAIRTAIAFHLLNNENEYEVSESQRISAIEKTLREKLKEGKLKSKSSQKFADDKLFMESIFSDFQLIYKGHPALNKTDIPNTDFMRAIQITDSEPIIEQENYNLSVIPEVIVCSHDLNHKAKYKTPIYVEMVVKLKTHFTIKIDKKLLSYFDKQVKLPFKKIDDIIEICNQFSQEQWEYEYDYWSIDNCINNTHAKDRQGERISLNLDQIRKFYKTEQCPYNLRLGWGSGMAGITIGLCYVDTNLSEEDSLMRQICDNCTSDKSKAPGFEAPKSRRVIADQDRQIRYVPGWVNLTAKS